MRSRRRLILLILQAFILYLIWGFLNYRLVQNRGLFERVGVDYALYTAGARIIASDNPLGVFDPAVIAHELQRFAVYYRTASAPGGNQIGPLPYPVPAFLLYAPFAWLSPPLGFALWAAVNFLVGAYAVWLLVSPVGRVRALFLAAAAITFPPFVCGLFFGQPIAFLLLAFALAYRAFQRGEDFAAGLWAGVLFLKVQYPIPLALVLAYKRRWRALAGMAVTGSALLAVSVLVCGPGWVTGYLQTVREMSGFRQVTQILWPVIMINWRGFLVVMLPPSVSEEVGTRLTLLLSGLTLASLLLIWRGPWRPTDPRFPARVFATLVVTLLATYHSHLHGAALLLVPALDLVVRRTPPTTLRWLLVAGFYLTTLLAWATGWSALFAQVFQAILLVLLSVVVFWELWSGPPANPRKHDEPQPPGL